MELTSDQVKKAVEAASGNAIERRRAYYEGRQTIAELQRPRIDGRVKSTVRTNWTKYATQMHAGFLTTRDTTYTLRGSGDEQEPLNRLKDVYDRNDLRAADRRLLADAICYGYGVEIHFFDGTTNRIVQTRPWEWTIVRDDSGDIHTAIRRLKVAAGSIHAGVFVEKASEVVEVYDAASIRRFKRGDKGELEALREPEPHFYGMPPVVVFQATEDGASFFSDAFLSQCDVFDVTRSSLQDDIRHNVDSMLKLKGVRWDQVLEKDKDGTMAFEKMKQLGLIVLKDKDQEAEYLSRVVDIEKFRYDLKITRAAIHMMACLPDLDETINGNEGTVTSISGIALKLMFQTMIQQASEFARRFEPGLRRRVDLLNVIDAKLSRSPLVGFDITMVPNIPFNDIELVQYLGNLKGVVSTREMLRLLPFVTDRERALRELLEEQAAVAKASNPEPKPDGEGTDQKTGGGGEIFGYHIDGGVVTMNEVRQRLGLPAKRGGDRTLPEIKAALDSGGIAGGANPAP